MLKNFEFEMMSRATKAIINKYKTFLSFSSSLHFKAITFGNIDVYCYGYYLFGWLWRFLYRFVDHFCQSQMIRLSTETIQFHIAHIAPINGRPNNGRNVVSNSISIQCLCISISSFHSCCIQNALTLPTLIERRESWHFIQAHVFHF